MIDLPFKARLFSARGVRIALWAAIALQIAAVFVATRPWLRTDSERYLELAANLAAGSFGSQTPEGFKPEAITPPGYPALLTLFLHILRLNIGAVVAIQLAAYAAGVFLIDRFARRERPLLANLFLFAVAGYVVAPLYVGAIMAEGFALLALTLVALAVAGSGRLPLTRIAVAGAVSGAATLIRPDLLLLPVAIGVAAILAEPRGNGLLRRFALPLAVPVLAAGIVLLPYAAWNAANFGRWTPLPRAGAVGTSLYLATWQRKLSLESLNAVYDGKVTEDAERAGLRGELVRLNRAIGAPPLTAVWNPMMYPTRTTQIRTNEVLLPAALERIRADPANYGEHVVRNVWDLWNISAYPDAIPPAVRTILAAISAAATLLGLGGAALGLIGVRGWPLTRGPALVMLYLPGLHLWLHTEARYTAPARLLLLLHAAALLWWAWDRFAKRADGATRDAPVHGVGRAVG